MTYTLVWHAAAVAGLLRLRGDDPATARSVRVAVSALARDPFPDGSNGLHGSLSVRRLRIGLARVLYDVDDDLSCVGILTVGRVARRG